jgi:tRNA modification GTPase
LDAKSTAQVRLSASRGLLTDKLSEAYRELLTLVSAAEALIDFPEEDLSEIPEEEFSSRLLALTEGIRALTRSYRTGRAVTEGIRTVIVGRPNVGKSSLYNLLVGEEAAIVTDVEGTTRDLLERTLSLGSVLLRLVDTAGLRETDDPVERIGVGRARAAMAEAELILAVFDASAPLTEEDRALVSELSASSAVKIAILNKADLPSRICREEIESAIPLVLTLSAKHGTADALAAEVERLFTDGALTIGEDAIVASARQYAALSRAEEALSSALSALSEGRPADMMLFDLTEALAALGEVDGRTVSEEIVSEIFRHFCVGK